MHNMFIEKKMEQFNSGESRTIFRNISCIALSGLTASGRKAWQEEEETRKDTSTVLILQEQLCISELFKDIQDAINVIIQSNFFEYIFHVGCAINLHSIINSGLIPEGQILSNRQTVFFLPVDPGDKNHKDPDTIDLSVPRHAQYLHKAWKRHQDAVYWVDINLATKKGLKFYQTRSNAIILQETLPAYCFPKVVRMETGEVIYEKVFLSPPPPPKIPLKHDWKRELGSEHSQQPEGQVGQLSRSFQFVIERENSRDEEVCRAWDVLADEDHTYHMSQEEYLHYRNKWWLHLDKSGNDTLPLRKRFDFKQALSTLNRLHREAGGEQIEPIPYWKYKQWKPASSSSST